MIHLKPVWVTRREDGSIGVQLGTELIPIAKAHALSTTDFINQLKALMYKITPELEEKLIALYKSCRWGPGKTGG